MRKVCPQCGGRKVVMVKIDGYPIDGIACLMCNKTGYIDVSDDSSEEAKDTINDNIKVTKKGNIKITKIGYFFDCQK